MANITISDINESYLVELNDADTVAVAGGMNVFSAFNQAFGIGVVDGNSDVFGNLFLNFSFGDIAFNF